MAIFRGFSKKNFRTNGLQLKLLILIESPKIFRCKPTTTTTIIIIIIIIIIINGCGLWVKFGPN